MLYFKYSYCRLQRRQICSGDTRYLYVYVTCRKHIRKDALPVLSSRTAYLFYSNYDVDLQPCLETTDYHL